jgi:predicted transcriptional regulator of viral defense system
MADARHSKCRVLRDVWVRLPPPASIHEHRAGEKGANHRLWSLLHAIASQTDHESPGASIWALARRQHGVVTRAQLVERGVTRAGISHRTRIGRLHRLHCGVFSVGTPDVSQLGRWMAAVLACGTNAALSHQSAAELWGIRSPRGGRIEVSVPIERKPRVREVRVHRRRALTPSDSRVRHRIPVTSPARTLTDLATRVSVPELEAAINQADKLDLIRPDLLRAALEG